MTRKLLYMLVLICGVSLFSSAKQMSIGCIKEYKDSTSKQIQLKKDAKPKKVAAATVRPFQFYLFNI